MNYSHLSFPLCNSLFDASKNLNPGSLLSAVPCVYNEAVLSSPQVSHASTAEILSDKVRFPTFLRTVPSDSYQTKAMARLIHRSGWNWIGIIATDDDFGRLAVESFGLQAMANNVCIAFKEMLPAYLSDSTIHGKINQALEKIVKETRVNVIVVFLRQFHVMRLFRKAIERNINKTWIASDNWSAAVKISTIPNISRLGKVVGFTFKSGNMSSFHDFLSNLHTAPNGNNTFSMEYNTLMAACSHINDQDLSKCIGNYSVERVLQNRTKPSNQFRREEFLIANIEPGFIHSTMLAVYAIANAIRNQCRARNCKDPYAFAPWEVWFKHIFITHIFPHFSSLPFQPFQAETIGHYFKWVLLEQFDIFILVTLQGLQQLKDLIHLT